MENTTYDLTNPLRPTILKDPLANLDYSFDWTDWLAKLGGDTIAAVIALVADSPSVTLGLPLVSGAVVTVFIAGGTLGMTHRVTCQIRTAAATPRIDERSIYRKMVLR